MNPAEHVIPPMPDAAAPESASIADLARSTSDYANAWSSLLVSETRLARVSAVRLVLAALMVPALALGIFIALDAVVATLLQRWLHDWASCIAIALFLDLAALCGLLFAMRRWWRNLSLPRSRDALVQLLRRVA